MYVNGNLEFSKLKSGNMPNFEVIKMILKKYGLEL
jgi:hypothetical protein